MKSLFETKTITNAKEITGGNDCVGPEPFGGNVRMSQQYAMQTCQADASCFWDFMSGFFNRDC